VQQAELELQKSAKKAQEAMTLVAEESAKSKAAKEVIKSLTGQLKDMAERLPPDDGNDTKEPQFLNGFESHASVYSGMNSVHQPRNESINHALNMPSLNTGRSLHPNGISGQQRSPGANENNEVSAHRHRVSSPHDGAHSNRRGHSSSDDLFSESHRAADSASTDTMSLQSSEDGYRSRGTISLSSDQVQAEWIEQYEPGVYITLTTLGDGTRDLKRVRFSRRRFGEHQAESWWNENHDKVYERYGMRSSERVSSAASTRSAR